MWWSFSDVNCSLNLGWMFFFSKLHIPLSWLCLEYRETHLVENVKATNGCLICKLTKQWKLLLQNWVEMCVSSASINWASISVLFVANTCMLEVQGLEFALSDVNVHFIVECPRTDDSSASPSCHPYFWGEAELKLFIFINGILLYGTDVSDTGLCFPLVLQEIFMFAGSELPWRMQTTVHATMEKYSLLYPSWADQNRQQIVLLFLEWGIRLMILTFIQIICALLICHVFAVLFWKLLQWCVAVV